MSESLDLAAEAFTALRPRLFGVAYRMLGSVSEAEDVVQDAWVRWQQYDRSTVENPEAFLVTVVTRLAINALQSARVKRESYVGPWLPEPVDTSADPALGAERAEALELAVLLLLERLTPTERASYVLREAFDHPYRRIAEVLEISEVSARQLVSRARKHVESGRRTTVAPDEHHRLLDAFLAAARAGNIGGLEALFADDVVRYSDGGGAARAARFPVRGRERVAQFQNALQRFFAEGNVRPAQVNGQDALVLTQDGALFGVASIVGSPEGITDIFVVLNPAKLSAFR
ncbi:RNA polymerase sigma-70 factor [Cryptosporangium phraense]|uniref:RNA polymerase sigma-70 factor n=1 Tax=Cryptosporangium phraense TaxID=2593070 RepID=A0A545AXJ2_9ACTN|nr:RNA polymerase sigma-70 factor [Cryptosporangium phraense]TQS46057.1 RNA polymerase sigma-70 factor [Cryptosporangium phraense]